MVVRSFPKYAPANAGGTPTTVPAINDSGQRLAESGLTTKYPMSAARQAESDPLRLPLCLTRFTENHDRTRHKNPTPPNRITAGRIKRIAQEKENVTVWRHQSYLYHRLTK
jgi:hypothetical protein